jgi:probable F420-dependent oxidoreductase
VVLPSRDPSAADPDPAPPRLPRFGLWSRDLAHTLATDEARAFVSRLERSGCGMVWLPESLGREALSAAALVLEWSEQLIVGTGIANVWARDAVAAQNGARTLHEASGGRFLLGLGISHDRQVAERGQTYRSPLQTMRDYLDDMDQAPWHGPGEGTPAPRVLAALGPKMLSLAADRTDGAHPYLVTPDHTATSRRIVGPDCLLAPEQGVVLETDPAEARAVARRHLAFYLGLDNYRNSFLRQGFEPSDLEDGGSDRLVDGLIAWGDEDAVAERLMEHVDNGADHVAVQILASPSHDTTAAFEALAPLMAT